nr:hypothetical protein BaRGS_007660 [Batillaria attramentaria]
MKLKRRQEKLRELFLEESRSLEAELKGMSRQNYDRVEAMKERAEGLRSAREEKRKRIAEEKLYDHWQQNNPDIRQVQSELLKDHVIDQWSHQIEEAEMKAEEERKRKEEVERQMEEERLAALELERQKEEKKLREEKELRDHLKKQMLELKQREEEAEELKYQQEILLRDQWEMERLEAERREKEEQRKRMDLGRALLHQHKAQMMRKSRRIQEELEQDRQLLEMMIEKEKEEISLQTARREKAQADAKWMKQVIEDQLRVEKAREAELDTLFQDEAARMWLKREGEWERERMARQRLMDEVLEGRQEQINAKLEEVQLRQQESLERREQLLQEIEIANQLTRREQEKAKAEQEALKHNLKEQIQERQHLEELSRLNLQEEEEEEKKADDEYQDFLRQETDRMRKRGYTPRSITS